MKSQSASQNVYHHLSHTACLPEPQENFSSWCWFMRRVSLGLALACAYRAYMTYVDAGLETPALQGAPTAHELAIKSNILGIVTAVAANYWASMPQPGLSRRLGMVLAFGACETVLYAQLQAAALLTKASVVRLHAFPLPVVFTTLCCFGTVLMAKLRREADDMVAAVEQGAKQVLSMQQQQEKKRKKTYGK